MNFRRYARRCTAWIACFAILVASIAPSVSHALAARHGSADFFGEICTSDEIRWSQAGDGQESEAPAQEHLHFEHCPFCSPHSGSFGLPPNAGFQLPIPIGQTPLPVLFYHSPRPLFIWAAAQSRAPPAL